MYVIPARMEALMMEALMMILGCAGTSVRNGDTVELVKDT
jgi:hypothetical protein